MKKWVWLTISWFGVSGCFNHARGTWGTLAALPFAFAVQYMLGNMWVALCGVGLFILGVAASEAYGKATGKQDPGEIVIDEVAAIFMMLAFMPMTWQSYLVAFIVFRIFDVVKPWPVCLADRHIKGGFGVMFDDVLAALYPIAIMALLYLIAPDDIDAIMGWLAG